MRPDYTEKYIADEGELSGDYYYKLALEETPWTNAGAPRMECFMATEKLTYGYDTKEGKRFYESVNMSGLAMYMLKKLNYDFKTDYNVCFLNYYVDEKQHLGWHSDDSPEMDGEHPIAVISFGEPRYIYVKEMAYKGVVPDEDKFLLGSGSLFVMPAGYQDGHLHKIPKGDRKMGGRISFTFRRFKK